MDAQIAAIRATRPPEHFVRAMVELPDRVPVTHLFHRGDHQQPKQPVDPADLTIAAAEGEFPRLPQRDPTLPTTGRRLAYARWLTSGQHPLVARVLVNRFWLHHFGQAIVATPAEFGKLGSPPTHPELLDWLADEFVRSGWDLKHLHRLILSSTAWRQSSVRQTSRDAIDGENKYYWRKSVQRLDAEVLRDRMLVASGSLDASLFGPPVAIKEDETGQIIVDGAQRRRSLYIKVRRTQPVAMLQSFDAPVMEVNCERRPVSTVATQSLILMNGEFTLAQAELIAQRATREAPLLDSSWLDDSMELPTPAEMQWRYGYGTVDDSSQKVHAFKDLPFWNGGEWQGGPTRPDPAIGWVIVNQQGGHPGGQFASIRRWTAPDSGTLKIEGTLHHANEAGDGVRGRIVSDRRGVIGVWQSHNLAVTTTVAPMPIQAGEAIDFVVDCVTNENADSFAWPVKLTITGADEEQMVRDSTADFHGPQHADWRTQLPSQLHHAWRLVLCREPTRDEWQLTLRFAQQQLAHLIRDPGGIAPGSSASQQVLTNFCHSLLNSNEFVYVD